MPRVPSWGHNQTQMALALGREFFRCRDGCGAFIIVVPTPKGDQWIPLEQIGEDPNPDAPSRPFRRMAIHHDLCTNARIPGVRDPTRSHRISVHEDMPALPEEQAKFELHRVEQEG